MTSIVIFSCMEDTMADDPIDTAVKDTAAYGVGGVIGGTILAPVAMGAAAALGLVIAPWAVVPIIGASVLGGMWGGKKVRDAAKAR
jgi:hypothetical protein